MQRLLIRLMPLILVLGGMVIALSGIVDLWHQHTYLPAKAEIVSIERHLGTGDDPDTYTVMVEYTVNGRVYYSDIGGLRSGYYEGKEIDILYDPNAPEKVTTQGLTGNIIAIAVGVLFMVSSILVARQRAALGGREKILRYFRAIYARV